MSGPLKTVSSRAAKAAVGLGAAAAAAGLWMPTLGAVVLLAAFCWVIGSQERTNRASQILRACRGAAGPEPVTAVPPAEAGLPERTLRLATSRKKHRG